MIRWFDTLILNEQFVLKKKEVFFVFFGGSKHSGRLSLINQVQTVFKPQRTVLSFQDFAVSTVPVCGGSRLKNICSMGGPDTIVFSSTEGAKKTLRVMRVTFADRRRVECSLRWWVCVSGDGAADRSPLRGPLCARGICSQLHLRQRPVQEGLPAAQACGGVSRQRLCEYQTRRASSKWVQFNPNRFILGSYYSNWYYMVLKKPNVLKYPLINLPLNTVNILQMCAVKVLLQSFYVLVFSWNLKSWFLDSFCRAAKTFGFIVLVFVDFLLDHSKVNFQNFQNIFWPPVKVSVSDFSIQALLCSQSASRSLTC